MKQFSDLKGQVLKNIVQYDNGIIFTLANDEVYKLYHKQDCCEEVFIDTIDIVGDLNDLLHTPILEAEEVSESGDSENSLNHPHFKSKPVMKEQQDYYTWTFYKLSTLKTTITFFWYGTSNGCYSEKATWGKVLC